MHRSFTSIFSRPCEHEVPHSVCSLCTVLTPVTFCTTCIVFGLTHVSAPVGGEEERVNALMLFLSLGCAHYAVLFAPRHLVLCQAYRVRLKPTSTVHCGGCLSANCPQSDKLWVHTARI